MTTTQAGVHTLRVHPQAVTTIADIGTQANCVSEFWHTPQKNPDWAHRCAVSAAKNLAHLFSWGESEVSRDFADLSLFVNSPSVGMVFGVIARPIVNADRALFDDIVAGAAPVKGRFCFERWESGAYCCAPVISGTPHCDHDSPLIFAAPLPMEWSFHS